MRYSESFVRSWRVIVSVYRTVPMYITDVCQNDRNENLNKKKFTLPGHAPRSKLSLENK